MSLEALFCDIDGFCQNFLPQCLLYLIINDQGELLAFHLTPGNVDDRRPLPRSSPAIRVIFLNAYFRPSLKRASS